MDEPRDKQLFSIWILKVCYSLFKKTFNILNWSRNQLLQQITKCLLKSVFFFNLIFLTRFFSYPHNFFLFRVAFKSLTPTQRLLSLSCVLKKLWASVFSFFNSSIQEHVLFLYSPSRIPCPSLSLNFIMFGLWFHFLSSPWVICVSGLMQKC